MTGNCTSTKNCDIYNDFFNFSVWHFTKNLVDIFVLNQSISNTIDVNDSCFSNSGSLNRYNLPRISKTNRLVNNRKLCIKYGYKLSNKASLSAISSAYKYYFLLFVRQKDLEARSGIDMP